MRTIWLWFHAARPWCYSVSVVPLLLGAVLAWLAGFPPRWGLFLLTLAAGVLLHTGVNYLNTYGDYVSGVDTVESADSCPHLVRGWLRPRPVLAAGLICLALAAVMGLALAWWCGWPVLVFGALGLAGGYCYTTGPLPYKYIGAGPVLVFFLMGPLMVCPAYYIQSGALSWRVFLLALPLGCLVSALMQANDIHDLAHDRASGIRTLALALGRERASGLLCAMYISAYLLLAGSVAASLLPLAALAPMLLLPGLARVVRNLAVSARREEQVGAIVYWAAGFHAAFGALLLAGLAVSLLWQ
ncbi:MAG: 1,4-dihydroxy-2-naphthoate octaprenyltransferase [Deltaproteobacteria bacterium]|jgi:1,4-dihydroxy-2-naphthoate octaprenyltransferase|nr:1,4-dihydroxy-2-naphthoate octaprenyltransferase [Deltaproteobacteria bacterium]